MGSHKARSEIHLAKGKAMTETKVTVLESVVKELKEEVEAQDRLIASRKASGVPFGTLPLIREGLQQAVALVETRLRQAKEQTK